jgi:hypothetical protein
VTEYERVFGFAFGPKTPRADYYFSENNPGGVFGARKYNGHL